MTGTSHDTKTSRVDESIEPTVRGPLIISRHGRPALDRSAGPKLTWQEYVKWWAAYEVGPLAEGQKPPKKLMSIVSDAVLVLSSGRLRAKQTAAMAAPHMEAEPFDIYNEAPLPPPRWKRRMLPRVWNRHARVAWMLGHSLNDDETVGEARARAVDAAAALHEHAEVGKVYLAAHGWFNRMIRKELRRKGWRCTYNGGDSYWSYRVYEWRE